jgi:hypothetical protein
MNSDHLPPDANPRELGAVSGDEAAEPLHAGCYVQAAPLLAVLQEQVSYLMSHKDQRCVAGCPDCARLEELRRCLLRPFA